MRCASPLPSAILLPLLSTISTTANANDVAVPAIVAAAPLAASAAPEQSLSIGRLERWLDDGDKDLVTQAFRRHPEEVLPFIDRYLETGLKIIEENGTYEDSMKLFRRAIKFSQAATDTWRDPIFIEYAGNFASWNETERRNFRAGQAAYKAGARAMKEKKTDEAAAHFRRALDLSEPLGDSWGMQMAYGGLAEAAMAASEWQAANDWATKAMDMAGRLQLRGDEIDQILICVEARSQMKTPDSGVGHARLAWSKVRRTDPQDLRQRVGEIFALALERTGRAEEAATIRKESCEEVEVDAGAQAPPPASGHSSPGASPPPKKPAPPAPPPSNP